LKRGDLVRRSIVSNTPVLGETWRWPPDKIFLVTRGPHEGTVYWSERAATLSIVIDVIEPGTGTSYLNQPISDFSIVRG
jgi:hypothetical protein